MSYATLMESDKPTGYYLKMDKSQSMRIPDKNDFIWAYGAEAPKGDQNLANHNFVPFGVTRFAYPVSLPYESVQNADWDVKLQYTQQIQVQCMTARVMRSVTKITTASEWQTTADAELSTHHTGTATAIAGGKLDVGTSTAPYLKKALDYAANLIQLDTGGVVQKDQLHVVMNPTDAALISQSAELHDYLKGSPDAMSEIREGSSPNAQYGFGLPTKLYGYDVVVDNTVKVTNRKGATLARSYVWPSGSIAIMARVGSLISSINAPNFSTFAIIWNRDEMTIEEFDDVKNRKYDYRVVEATTELLVSPISGYLITSATA